MTKIRTDGSAVKQLIASDRDPETPDPRCGAGSYRSRDGGGAGRGEARLGYRSGYYTRSLITRGEGAAGPSGAVLDRASTLSALGEGTGSGAGVRTSVLNARGFATAPHFAAWTGLTPRAQSSGGKERFGAVSKRGNRQLRTLLILGATSIIKLGKRGLKVPLWIRIMLQRRPSSS